MRRQIFTFASSVSLVWCLAAMVMWVRSYWVTDEFCVTDADGWAVYAYAARGGIAPGGLISDPGLTKGVALAAGIGPQGGWSHTVGRRSYSYRDTSAPFDQSLNWRLAGFGLLGGQTRGRGSVGLIILIPYWGLAGILSLMPGLWALHGYRCRRLSGHCVQCRYDLTGNTSGVCPECGTAVGATDTKETMMERRD